MHITSYFTYIKEIFSSKEIFQVVLSFFLFVWIIFIATSFDILASNSEEFKFALPDTQDNKYTIRFKINKLTTLTTLKSVGMNNDKRKLDFGFIEMKLLSEVNATQ